ALNIPVMKGGINADFSYFDLPAPGITLAPGETRGIYVVSTPLVLVNSAGAGSTNGDLTLSAGAATGALFGGTIITAREPNIRIHYGSLGAQVDPSDNCSIVSLTHVDNTVQGSCATNSGVVRRTWKAVDQSGNTTTCLQTITFLRPSIGSVQFPENYDGLENDLLDCTTPYPDPAAPVVIKDTFVLTGPFTIPDNGTLSIPFDFPHALSASRVFRDMNIRINLVHPNVSHLNIWFQQLDGN